MYKVQLELLKHYSFEIDGKFFDHLSNMTNLYWENVNKSWTAKTPFMRMDCASKKLGKKPGCIHSKK